MFTTKTERIFTSFDKGAALFFRPFSAPSSSSRPLLFSMVLSPFRIGGKSGNDKRPTGRKQASQKSGAAAKIRFLRRAAAQPFFSAFPPTSKGA